MTRYNYGCVYFTPEDFFNVFIRLLSQVLVRDAPGISEKDVNRSKSTKVTVKLIGRYRIRNGWQLLDAHSAIVNHASQLVNPPR